MKGFVIALAAAMLLVFAPATRGEAATKQRPAGGDRGTCEVDVIDSGADSDCEGSLCWCCYTDGCWICDKLNAPGDANCAWDPAYRVRQVRPEATGSGGVLETTPQPNVTITPGRSKKIERDAGGKPLHTFPHPALSGNCGQPAATAFCRTKGYRHAAAFQIHHNIGAAAPTRVIGNDAVCTSPGCDGFLYIQCSALPPRGDGR